MPWRKARQTRIFTPNAPPFEEEYWYQQVLGQVVLPLFQSYRSKVKWLWFTRYVSRLGDDDGDCDISKLPSNYLLNNAHRSIRLRFCAQKVDQKEFEGYGQQLIDQTGCFLSDWRDYDVIGDLGSDRFVSDGTNYNMRAERAKLVVDFLYSNSRLVLSCLVGPESNGRWMFEHNAHPQNPHNSTFESIHHLFCNTTAVPLFAFLIKKNEEITLGTHWRLPPSPGWEIITELPISF